MKNLYAKRVLALALTGTLLAGSSLGASAAPPSGNRQAGPQMSQQGGSAQMSDSRDGRSFSQGQPPQMNESSDSGESTQQGQTQDQSRQKPAQNEVGAPKELPEGAVDIVAVEKTIEAITDETTKANIQSLLDDLKAALQNTAVEIVENTDGTAEDTTVEDFSTANVSAIQAAEEALKAGLEAAGIDLSEYAMKAPEGTDGSAASDGKQDPPTMQRDDRTSTESAPVLPEITDENKESVFQQTADFLGSHLQDFYNWLTELLSGE